MHISSQVPVRGHDAAGSKQAVAGDRRHGNGRLQSRRLANSPEATSRQQPRPRTSRGLHGTRPRQETRWPLGTQVLPAARRLPEGRRRARGGPRAPAPWSSRGLASALLPGTSSNAGPAGMGVPPPTNPWPLLTIFLVSLMQGRGRVAIATGVAGVPPPSALPRIWGAPAGAPGPGTSPPSLQPAPPPRIASLPALQLPPHADRTHVYFQVPSGESASEQHSGLLSSQESHNLPFSFFVRLRLSPFLPSALGRVSRWLEFARPGRPARAAAASLRGSLLPAPGCAQGSPFCTNRILRSGSIVIVSRSL